MKLLPSFKKILGFKMKQNKTHKLKSTFTTLIVSTLICLCLSSALIWLTSSAEAQSLSIDLGGDTTGGESTARIIQIIALVTVLSLAPAILIMMTSFVRIMVVLSFLRTAIGTQQTPPNQVLISLALFLTLFVMMPTFEAAFDAGIKPLIEGEIDEFESFNRSVEPFRVFMTSHVREQDVALFADQTYSEEAYRANEARRSSEGHGRLCHRPL